MALPDGAHLLIGDVPYELDLRSDDCYVRWAQAVLPRTDEIAGNPGANLDEHELRWDITNFSGENQKVIDPSDPDSPSRFYQSEGLDFRTAGEFRLNRSTVLQRPAHTGGGTTATLEGNAGFVDVTGTSTTSGTDRRVNLINDKVKSSVHAPGVGTVQVDFFLYHEEALLTTTEGSSFDTKQGTGRVSATDHTLEAQGTTVGTVDLTGLTAGAVYEVNFYAMLNAALGSRTAPTVRCQVVDTTRPASPVVVKGSPQVDITSTTSSKIKSGHFTPVANTTYQFWFVLTSLDGSGDLQVLADKVEYGPTLATNNTVTIEVYNDTGAASVVSKSVVLTSTAAGNHVASLTYTAAAVTDYTYRVSWTAGGQRPWVDKVFTTIQTSGSNLVWNIEAMDLGQGGLVWALGHNASGIVTSWTYNFATEAWTNRVSPAGTTNMKTLATAHTDAYEYALLDNKVVWQLTTSAANAYIAATTATARGVAICQNRMFVLGEDSTNGVNIYLYALDQTALPVAVSNTVVVSGAKNTPDATLRQRMTGSPTGARYFVNYADGTASVYECDSSPASPTNRMLDTLDGGVKLTAIYHTDGKTFFAGQYKAETGETAVSALWMIDESGYRRPLGEFRSDGTGSTAHIQKIGRYRESLWLLQGEHIWTYNLARGGSFLEYKLTPTTNTDARDLVVVQGHQFAANATEGIFVTGSIGTYRQSGQNTHTTSITDFGLPGTRKALWGIEVVTDSIASGGQVKVEYQIDQSGTWVHAGSATAGSHNIFNPSTGTSTVMFNTLQVRTTLGSGNGTVTPVVKNIIIRALPLHDAEFLDVQLLLRDQTSIDHPATQQYSGGELAGFLWATRNANRLVTVTDAFFHSSSDINNRYLARIEAIKQVNTGVGNGTAFVRLRLLGEAA